MSYLLTCLVGKGIGKELLVEDGGVREVLDVGAHVEALFSRHLCKWAGGDPNCIIVSVGKRVEE